MKETSRLVLAGALALSAIAGCGGNVVVDPTGGNGGEGGGTTTWTPTTTTPTTTSTPTPTPTTTTTSTITTTPGNPQLYCASVCKQGDQYGCLDGTSLAECVQGCVSIFQDYPECSEALISLYDCVVGQLPQSGCDFGEACQGPSNVFAECINGSTQECGEFGCSGGDDSCYCEGECYGQYLQVECKKDVSGYYCNCYMGGDAVGSCNDPNGSCGIFDGCCSAYFFGEEG